MSGHHGRQVVAVVVERQPGLVQDRPDGARGEGWAEGDGGHRLVKQGQVAEALGASFLLLDANGQEVGSGKVDVQGKLAFPELAPDVYRLKETASGSPLDAPAAVLADARLVSADVNEAGAVRSLELVANEDAELTVDVELA